MEMTGAKPELTASSAALSPPSETSRTTTDSVAKVVVPALASAAMADNYKQAAPAGNSETGDWGLPQANFAATGGAVAALALGLWSGLTCWLTPWTAVNAVLGLAMGIWGLKSPRKRIAVGGIGLNLIAIFLTLWL
jgi:hypothetical protein